VEKFGRAASDPEIRGRLACFFRSRLGLIQDDEIRSILALTGIGKMPPSINMMLS
jgi:hypothetical protein